MSKSATPCYKCPDRHATCHDTCERYHTWQDENKKKKASMYGGSISDAYNADAISNSKARIAKYKQTRRIYFKKHY